MPEPNQPLTTVLPRHKTVILESTDKWRNKWKRQMWRVWTNYIFLSFHLRGLLFSLRSALSGQFAVDQRCEFVWQSALKLNSTQKNAIWNAGPWVSDRISSNGTVAGRYFWLLWLWNYVTYITNLYCQVMTAWVSITGNDWRLESQVTFQLLKQREQWEQCCFWLNIKTVNLFYYIFNQDHYLSLTPSAVSHLNKTMKTNK